VGKPDERRPFGRPRRRWEILKVGWGVVSMVWVNLAQNRDKWLALINAVMNLGVP
jgi:hypothetical protein